MTNNPSLDLIEFIETQILPQYAHFDKAHNMEHVTRVIRSSLALARTTGADIDMAYTVAAYHDLGLSGPRAVHHITSGKILMADVRLRRWFSPEQIKMMKQATDGQPGSERIHGVGMNILDESVAFPTDTRYDVIWMSQFLDCFSEQQIVSILRRAAAVLDSNNRIYIMETLWDRQDYVPAAMSLTMTSLYFTALANGNSKMYNTDDLTRLIRQVGLEIEQIYDRIGNGGHSILVCKK